MSKYTYLVRGPKCPQLQWMTPLFNESGPGESCLSSVIASQHCKQYRIQGTCWGNRTSMPFHRQLGIPRPMADQFDCSRYPDIADFVANEAAIPGRIPVLLFSIARERIYQARNSCSRDK